MENKEIKVSIKGVKSHFAGQIENGEICHAVSGFIEHSSLSMSCYGMVVP